MESQRFPVMCRFPVSELIKNNNDNINNNTYLKKKQCLTYTTIYNTRPQLLCYVLFQRMWKVQQSISFNRKVILFFGFCKQRATYASFCDCLVVAL